MNVAIIPARSGSKRIPKKNIKSFCGKPIIYWPIDVIKKSNIFDKIIVSTDDEEIGEIARSFGAETPFIRPQNISDDFANVSDVMCHAVKWLEQGKYNLNTICCIYATAVFLAEEDLKIGYRTFLSQKWNYVFSGTTFPFPIQRAFKRNDNQGIEMFERRYLKSRSQDLEKAYHDAAQFYYGKSLAWVNKYEIFNKDSEAILLPRWRIQDIDTVEDWINAELMFKTLKNNSSE